MGKSLKSFPCFFFCCDFLVIKNENIIYFYWLTVAFFL